MPPEVQSSIIKTGVSGLDDVLCGGLTANRLYLIHGTPGSGKTTLALQFLLDGVRNGEKGLYVTLSETRAELEAVATSHGWSLDGLDIYEMAVTEEQLEPENQFTMYQPSELELNLATKDILERFEQLNPTRVVIDSLSEIRLLAQNALRYRRQILALKQYFAGRQCTVLFLDDKTSESEDMQLESIAHAVINLEQLSPEYGAERRRLRVTKFRGVKYRGGYHDFIIAKGGLRIFPRLVAAEHCMATNPQQLKSGIGDLDEMLGGGIEHGTSVLLLGPAGAGKSSTAMQYAVAAAERGEQAALFCFDERVAMLLHRARGLGIPLQKHVDAGRIHIQSIDPAELSPGEFASYVRAAAEGQADTPGAQVIVIDSLNGYLNSMPEERYLTSQLHELLTYLGHKGVVTFLVVAQHGLLGNTVQAPIDTSYLADSVVLFRYFEAQGEVRQAISVVKKRSGSHERTIREFIMSDKGLKVGTPLREFHGVLTGTPTANGLPVENSA